jgi:hypothetical protein
VTARTSIEKPADDTRWPAGMFLEKKLITAWLTFPSADKGIEKVVAEEPSRTGALITFSNGLNCSYYGLRENVDWHRTKEAAIVQAEKLRRGRIDKANTEIARLLALPPIGKE